MSREKLWLVKYANNRLGGPLSTEDVIQQIFEKKILGEETISVYPRGRWKPISTEPLFYEPLLKVLSLSDESAQAPPSSSTTSSSPSSDSLSRSNRSASMSSATVVADLSELKTLRQKRKKKRQGSSFRFKQKPSEEKTVIYRSVEEEQYDEAQTSSVSKADKKGKDKSLKSRFYPARKKKRIWASLIVLGVLAGAFFLSGSDQEKTQEYIELKKPLTGRPVLSKEQRDFLVRKSLLQYLQDTVSSYQKAQALLVQAVEGDIKNAYPMALLCMVYLELWPFSRQDVKAKQTMSDLVHKTSVLNKGGVKSGLCHAASLLLEGQYKAAKTMVESSLDGLASGGEDKESQKLIPLFYYLKARLFYLLNDYSVLVSYLDTIRKILPNWIAPYMLMAEILLKQNKVSESLSMYKKVIKLNPAHKTAKIRAGLIEYRHFNKVELAEQSLKMALASSEIVSHQTLSELYFALAEINLKKGESSSALKYARLAYSYNPANQATRNLVLKIGGVKKLKQTKVKSDLLVYAGDQLVLQNKFRAAIGYYEEAFKIDNEENAVVAVKTAESYQALSFSDQAINWLKKAINADPNMMRAYVLMAEYYATRHDFHNAEKILKIAFKKQSGSYELYRGRAHLALKREDYHKAVRYGKMALRIYEADVDSYVILSEAYAKLGDMNESLASAARGLEVDPNAVKTQIAYAKAMGNMYGAETGAHYFRTLVENYPLIMEYRMELVKYLFEDEQYEYAKKILLQLISVEPKYNTAYFYLGRILMFDRAFKKAYQAFLQAAILDPSDPRPTFYIAQLRLKEKKYNIAKRQFKKVLALNKLYPKAHYYLGRIAFLQGDYEEAVRQARLESRAHPRLILPYLLAGEAYEKNREFLNCSIEYQKAVELNPNNTAFYVKTARCYRQAGYLDLAVKILKKAGEGPDFASDEDTISAGSKSGDPQLYKEFGMIYEIKGKYREAVMSYCNYLNLMPRAPDRGDIEKRMKKLSGITGTKMQACG